MSPADWNDDEHEPLAPLPAHERTWRHPSEVGDHEWRMSEPPLVLGRGLMFTTSVVTGLLVFAVLWTALPTRAGRGAISATPTLVSLGDNSIVGLEGPTALDGDGDASIGSEALTGDGGRDVDGVAGLTMPRPTPVLRPTSLPSPTVQVHPTVPPGAADAPADVSVVAVAVHDGSLLITTAPAVDMGGVVEIEFADGATSHAEVLLIDHRHGLAVLAPLDDTWPEGASSLDVSTDVEAGEELTVVGADDVTVTVGSGGAAAVEFDEDDEVPEGAPVVNADGELVALCTHDDDGTARLVTLESLDQIRQAMADTAASADVWLGLVINDDPDDVLSVGAVDPSGPAAAAGIQPGDVIFEADGVALADCDALVAYLTELRPGDTVRFSVRGTDGGAREVAVVLAEPKTAL